MGPIIKLQVMRGDTKHQTFTRYAKRTNNFINICKTLAYKHQTEIASTLRSNTFDDKIKAGKKIVYFTVKNSQLKVEFESHLHLFSERFEELNNVIIKEYLIVNSCYFKKGLFVVFSDHMHKIESVLEYKGSFVLLCTKFIAVKFHKFKNCIELKTSSEISLINFSQLQCHKSYEAKFLNGKTQIIADTLDIISVYEGLLQNA